MLPSRDVIYLLAARAARISVIKRDEIFISVFSQNIANLQKVQRRLRLICNSTQADQRFRFPHEYDFVWVLW